jgi:hypothetical protein
MSFEELLELDKKENPDKYEENKDIEMWLDENKKEKKSEKKKWYNEW